MNYNLHQAQSHDVLRSWQCQRNNVNHHNDFVLPIFVGNDDDAFETIESMPDVYRYGANTAIDYLEPLIHTFGLRAVLLFPVVIKSEKEELDRHINELEKLSELLCPTPLSSTSPSSSSISSSSSSSSPSDCSCLYESEGMMKIVHSETCRSKRRDRRGEQVSLHDQMTNSLKLTQNPFLNQNDDDDDDDDKGDNQDEEEQDHLLGDDDLKDKSAQTTSEPLRQSTQSSPPQPPQPTAPPAPPPRNQETLRKKMYELDVKYIREMALKDYYNPVLRLIPKLRQKFPELLIICDVCLCAFTSTGHCCLFDENDSSQSKTADTKLKNEQKNQSSSSQFHNHLAGGSTNTNSAKFPNISNKITCQYLAMLAVEYAKRGCNVVAPSDMMDGRILTIRERLNENNLKHVAIMSYSAKFASAFYGPFRQATNNAPEFGDRRAYQLPPGSRALAFKSIARDIEQGADFVMVKPAGPYLDIVRDIREKHEHIPIAVYQVSGEYAMLKLAAKANLVDLKQAVNEYLTSFRRAGANIIITYFTPELLRGEI